MGHQHQHHQRATAASNTATVLLIRLNGHPSSLFVRRSFSFWSDMCPPFVSIEQGSIDHTTLVHSVAILNGCLFSNSRWRWYSPRWSSSIWIIAHRPTNQYVDHTCVSYIPSYSIRAHTHTHTHTQIDKSQFVNGNVPSLMQTLVCSWLFMFFHIQLFLDYSDSL